MKKVLLVLSVLLSSVVYIVLKNMTVTDKVSYKNLVYK